MAKTNLIEKIGLRNVFNVILVNENVRPAMLVQPQDYGEATHNDPITKSIIEIIKEHFPNLIISDNYEIYQGVIISKTNYNFTEYIDLETMGKILGYPCYQGFSSIDPDAISYCVEIIVREKNGIKSQLIANKSKNKLEEENIKTFEEIANNAKIAFNKKEYASILYGVEIHSVYVKINEIIPVKTIINHIIEKEEAELLEDNEIYEILNILYNIGFSDEFRNFFSFFFQYNNPIHKGILLGLLLNHSNDTLSPFYPLQKYPKQEKMTYKIIEKWETSLRDILEKTRTSFPSSSPPP